MTKFKEHMNQTHINLNEVKQVKNHTFKNTDAEIKKAKSERDNKLNKLYAQTQSKFKIIKTEQLRGYTRFGHQTNIGNRIKIGNVYKNNKPKLLVNVFAEELTLAKVKQLIQALTEIENGWAHIQKVNKQEHLINHDYSDKEYGRKKV